MNNKKHFTRTDKRTTGMMATIWILAGIALCLVVAVVSVVRMERKTRDTLMLQYDRALSDMSDAVARSEEYLLKAMAAHSAQKTAEMLQEAARASAFAEGSMALLPLDAEISGKISNYLVQVDDLAKVWASAAISDELKSSQVNLEDGTVEASSDGKQEGWAGFTKDNYALLQELHGYSLDLSAALSELALRVTDNDHSWDNIEKDARTLLSDPFQDYPVVQYDGPYSDHMKNLKAKGLTGPNIQYEQGMEHVRKIFKDVYNETPDIHFTGENTLNGMDLLCYEVSHEDRTAYVTLTKKGGILCDLVFNRESYGDNLTQSQCEEAGSAFLKALGLGKMELIDTEIAGGVALLTFCYVDQGVYCYPDSVKIKVSGETGEVTGYDAYQYLMHHMQRKIETGTTPVISMHQATNRINPKLTIERVRDCYLANNYGGEDRLYEFHCTGLGHEFLIYIDGEDGSEVRIEIAA